MIPTAGGALTEASHIARFCVGSSVITAYDVSKSVRVLPGSSLRSFIIVLLSFALLHLSEQPIHPLLNERFCSEFTDLVTVVGMTSRLRSLLLHCLN